MFVRPVRRLAADRFARRHRQAGKAAFTAEVKAAGRTPSLDSLTVGEEPASAEVRERPGLPAESTVVARRRRYLVDGRPAELATCASMICDTRATAWRRRSPVRGS